MDTKERIVFTFDENDVFTNTQFHKNHRDYIRWRFAQLGFAVTKWNWERNPLTNKWINDKTGIEFKRTDSDIQLRFEVSGIVGQNIRRLTDDERK